jgi:hypothetical protein
VAQLYGLMVEAVRGAEVLRYVATAGVLAHYVGDACRPLHASEVLAGVNTALADHPPGPPKVTGSDEAADAAVALMQRTIDAIPPADIVAVFTVDPGPGTNRPVVEHLWRSHHQPARRRGENGGDAVECGLREGGGETIDTTAIKPLSKPALQKLDTSTDFAPSVWLKDWDTLPRP